MTNITNFQDILGATNGDKTSVLGKFLYFSLANILVEKEALAQLCEDLNIPYSGSKRISVSDAFRSATGDIKDRITVKSPGAHHIYAVYCRDNAHTEDVCSRELVKETLNQRTNQYEKLANIGQIPNLEKLVATIRSREISACLVLQAQSQLKAIYKDNADTIIGNMDSRIFLGGSEPTTLKELNQALGKETIDTYNTSNTRGNSPSYGLNYQKLGKDLASVDELAVLDGSKCILQLRGVRPFLSDKYDLTQHPNYKYTSDFDKRNEFNIEQFLSRRLKLKAGDEFVVVDAD